MSRILIIPDLHQQLLAGENMLREGLKMKPDRIVFLGDLFDDFYDRPEDSAKTAIWFNQWSERLGDRLIVLYGNHDLPYAEASYYLAKHGDFPADYRPALYCSGFAPEKARAIYETFGLAFWKPWRLHYREDGVLFTHAGADAKQEATLDIEAAAALKSVTPCDREAYSGVHPLLLPGPDRGGLPYQRPGITWRDIDEFDGSTACPQIFAHSRKNAAVRFTANAVCMDAGFHAFALLDAGRRLRIISSGEEKVQALLLPEVDSRYMATARQHGSFLVREPGVQGKLVRKGWSFTVDFPLKPPVD